MTVSIHVPFAAIVSRPLATCLPISARCVGRRLARSDPLFHWVFGVVLSAGRLVAMMETWRRFKDLFDPYRPELHYMRGPGPKSRERALVTTLAFGKR